MTISTESHDGSVPVTCPKPKITPLPIGQLTILCIVLLTESICSTVLVPFGALFVSFLQGWSKEEAGYASGFLVGLYMLGQVVSSKAWGVVSDKYGRKLTIGLGVSGSVIAMFFFGLSWNIYVACFWRFFHGLSGGCSLAAKTMITDVTDRTNQAKGFALVSLTWGVGTLFGPAIGGFLYDPANVPAMSWLGISKDGFLAHYPAFLPSFAVSLYNLFAVFVCVFFLNETNRNMQPLYKAFPVCIGDKLRPCLELIQPKGPVERAAKKGKAAQEVVVVATNDDGASQQGTATPVTAPTDNENGFAHENDGENAIVVAENTITTSTDPDVATQSKPPSFGFKQAFENPLTRDVCIMSMLLSASDMLYATIFPLWTIASVQAGGLGLSQTDIGVLILVNSFPAVGGNIVFAPINRWFQNEMKFWQICHLFYAITTLAIPIATYFGSSGGYWYAMAMGMIRKLFESWAFAILMLAVAITAPPGKIGIMYGIQQATACIVRAIVPFVGAPLFAWSIAKPRPFPLDEFLLFILSAIPLFVSLWVSRKVTLPSQQDSTTIENDAELPDNRDGRLAVEDNRLGNASFALSWHSIMD